jgi:hypothetical protein
MPQEEILEKYPSLRTLAVPDEANKRAWVAVFNARPDAMHALIADFIKQVHAKPGKLGQRPLPKEEQVDFQALMYGDFSDEPLHVLLTRHPISARNMAMRLKMNRERVRLMYAGEYIPDVDELRRIAGVFGKPPAYFMEYRKAMAAAAFMNLMDEHPGMAGSIYLNYLEVRMRETA